MIFDFSFARSSHYISKTLDAELALGFYDGKESWFAARLFINIKPLYYGLTKEEGMTFASEVKSLVILVRAA